MEIQYCLIRLLCAIVTHTATSRELFPSDYALGALPPALELGGELAEFFAAEACARAGKEPLPVSLPALAYR